MNRFSKAQCAHSRADVAGAFFCSSRAAARLHCRRCCRKRKGKKAQNRTASVQPPVLHFAYVSKPAGD